MGDCARDVLRLEPGNSDALSFLAAAERDPEDTADTSRTLAPVTGEPASFANDRYQVKRFLGEGGKKKVYLAQDTLLDREVAFALIKTEGLDETSRTRIQREAQAMGRLGSHPHIVTVFDLGEEQDQPNMVTELMGGGDVEGVIEEATDHRCPWSRQSVSPERRAREWSSDSSGDDIVELEIPWIICHFRLQSVKKQKCVNTVELVSHGERNLMGMKFFLANI